MKRTAIWLAIVASLTAIGCLQKETSSTIYLQPDGSFDWIVLEQHVRSDESEPARRAAEELAYLDAVAGDRHEVAESFRALGGVGARTRLLREARPYAVMIDAHFASVTGLVDAAFAGCGVPYEISQTVEGDVTTWRLWADVGIDASRLDGQEACGSALVGLSDALEPTIVLASGEFTGAEGFTLAGRDRATLDDEAVGADALKRNNGLMVFSLSWKADPSR